jgi:ribonuclease III
MKDADWPGTWLRERLGYEPRDTPLFAAALTHRSSAAPNNERLEFLGDAVLNLVIADRLYREFPGATEGDLSRLRARIVSSEPLASVAQELSLGDTLQMGSGELKSGGFRRESILADAFEALCGALYIDGGLEAAREFIESRFESRIASLPAPESLKDAKTRLQELLQARGIPLPRYVVARIEGEPHAQTFQVSCEVPALGKVAHGSGSSRRRAEQEAAERVLLEIETETEAGPDEI